MRLAFFWRAVRNESKSCPFSRLCSCSCSPTSRTRSRKQLSPFSRARFCSLRRLAPPSLSLHLLLHIDDFVSEREVVGLELGDFGLQNVDLALHRFRLALEPISELLFVQIQLVDHYIGESVECVA